MVTTFFAIFSVAVVATLAWVITRIVNIFVELEQLKRQAEDITERMSNHVKKVNDLRAEVDKLNHANALTAEHLGVLDEQMNELCNASIELATNLKTAIESVNTKCECVAKNTEAQEAKQARVVEYIKLRDEGKTIRQAGEEVGVAYVTAKRYEKQRKAQSNESGNN